MSSLVLWALPREQVWIWAESFLSRHNLHHANNKGLVVMSSTLSLCRTADERLIHFHRPLSTDSVSLGPNHANA